MEEAPNLQNESNQERLIIEIYKPRWKYYTLDENRRYAERKSKNHDGEAWRIGSITLTNYQLHIRTDYLPSGRVQTTTVKQGGFWHQYKTHELPSSCSSQADG